jgi:tetratricopeptide (TPR) repeat protein
MSGCRPKWGHFRWLEVSLAILVVPMLAWGDAGVLQVLVQDAQKHPVKGVEIGLEGSGGSRTTGDDGKVLLPLPKDTNENDWVSLQIVRSPAGKDWQMVSPWDNRYLVPSFKNKPENFVRVIVVQRGDRAALETGSVLAVLTAKINRRANAPQSPDKQQAEDPKASLNAVAKQYGVTSEELDSAIRAWGKKTTDPYEAGLAALYTRNYDAATTSLQASLKQREEKFATAQEDVADAAFFLGQSLYEQGHYKESAAAYQRCLQIRPDDVTVLNNTALSLKSAGDYKSAEALYRLALALAKKTSGAEGTDVAVALNNLGLLLKTKGDYAGAELLYRQALAINENSLGPNNPRTADNLNNLAVLLSVTGDYARAEPLFCRALAIDEAALGPDHSNVARDSTNLGSLLQSEGDYRGAESLFRRAVAIIEKSVGPDHPNVATCLNNLALLLVAKGDFVAAEPLYRRALAINEAALGPNHPLVAGALNNLAMLLERIGNYSAAEPLLRRAVAIDEKALGPDHPTTRAIKENLDECLQESAQAAAQKPKN